jgi:hypothetical protein
MAMDRVYLSSEQTCEKMRMEIARLRSLNRFEAEFALALDRMVADHEGLVHRQEGCAIPREGSYGTAPLNQRI